MARLEKELRASRRNERRLLRHALRTRESLDALLRNAYVSPEDADYPQRLTLGRFGILSQNAEDGVVLALVHAAGAATRSFVEIGCGSNGGNSGVLARELGWRGLMLDGSDDAVAAARLRFNPSRVALARRIVTAENVNDLLAEHDIGGELDFLGIDIDGNDIWVWQALEACSPRIVAVEFNAFFGPDEALAVPYDPAWTYTSGSDYFGASLAALAAVGARKGYRLVCVEPRGANAFFLRSDVALDVPGTSAAEAYQPLVPPAALYEELGGERARSIHARRSALAARVQDEELPLVSFD